MAVLIENRQKSRRLNLRRIKRDLNRALLSLGLQRSELSIVFVGDAEMRKLNRLYRQIDRTTDVLSFPLTETGFPRPGDPLGDIVVSMPKATAQAAEYGVSLRDEILRLLVHGLLHLVGYDHERNTYQKRRMQKKERELLDAVAQVD
ncbi:MAG: rRNA maturation RNase YbeY [Nitrospiraceae bacterium]|nr:rRNA maturation RNase YbeY [Nitrospiraceae bacterium]